MSTLTLMGLMLLVSLAATVAVALPAIGALLDRNRR